MRIKKLLTEEILNFKTIEDFFMIRNKYQNNQKVKFQCNDCGKEVIRTVYRIFNLINYKEFFFLCQKCGTKKTSLKKYGVEHPTQSIDVKLKNKKTHFENNKGVWMNQNQKNAITKAFKEKREQIIEHRKQTCIEKYGVEYAQQSEEVKKKTENTCISKYGFKSPSQNQKVKEKTKQTFLKNLGVDNPQHSKKIREKTKQTCIEKYGSDSFLSSEEGKNKIKNIFQEKYGVENPSQVKEFQNKKIKKYKYQDQTFDSSWELALWIYAKDHNEEIEREPISLNYIFKGKVHKVFPDFKYKGKLIEIKGPQFFNKKGEIHNFFNNGIEDLQLKLKFEEEKKNGVEFWYLKELKPILDYIKEKYGKDYLNQFKR